LLLFFFLAACLLFSLIFFFFPWVLVILFRGYADLSQGCLWEYHMPLSSLGGPLFPSRFRAGIWRHRSPPGFSI
jgi:hypothetical protein